MDGVVVHMMAMCNTRYKIEENKLKWNIFWHTNTIFYFFPCNERIAYGIFIHLQAQNRWAQSVLYANFTTTNNAIPNSGLFCIFRMRFALKK